MPLQNTGRNVLNVLGTDIVRQVICNSKDPEVRNMHINNALIPE